MLDREVVLHAQPRRDGDVLLPLRSGEMLRVLERSGDWLRAAHRDGAGWTERAGVGRAD